MLSDCDTASINKNDATSASTKLKPVWPMGADAFEEAALARLWRLAATTMTSCIRLFSVGGMIAPDSAQPERCLRGA